MFKEYKIDFKQYLAWRSGRCVPVIKIMSAQDFNEILRIPIHLSIEHDF